MDDGRRVAKKLGEQPVGETLAPKGESLKELRVGEAADAVVQKDATVLIRHVLPRRSLRRTDAILDDLENDVERRQGEHRHDQAFDPRRLLEACIRLREVMHQRAIELSL